MGHQAVEYMEHFPKVGFYLVEAKDESLGRESLGQSFWKMWMRSASTDSKKVTKPLAISTPRFLGILSPSLCV